MSINQYKIQKQIGQGSFATVYKAQKITTHQKVAIKIIKNTLTVQENLIATKQINALKNLQHQNIINLKQHFLVDNSWYLIFEYCTYGDLQTFWKKKKPFSEQLTKSITFQLVNALKFLQEKKTAHRDIKLANILINQQYCIKLADLGFAKIGNHQSDLFNTYAGTPLMMAPEVLQKKAYTIKCDVWSLGIIIYMMLFQENPFYPKNNGLQQLKQLTKSKPVQFPNSKKVSENAKQFIKKCLQKDPQRRINSQEMLKSKWLSGFKKQNSRLKKLLCEQLLDEKFDNNQEQTSVYQTENIIFSQVNDNIKSHLIIFVKQMDQKINSLIGACKNIKKIESYLSQEQRIILYNILINRYQQLQNSKLEVTFNQEKMKFSYKYDDYFKNYKSLSILITNIKNTYTKLNSIHLQKQVIRVILKLYNATIIQQQQPDSEIYIFILNLLDIVKIHFSYFKINLKKNQSLDNRTYETIKKKLVQLRNDQILKLLKQSKQQYQKKQVKLIDMFQREIQLNEEIKQKQNITYLQQFFRLVKFK